MEVKQEFSENTLKAEVDIYYNKVDDALLDGFKTEIKEESNIDTHDEFDYLDLKEFPIKTELDPENKLVSFEEKQTMKMVSW
ncbi:unnamed protein product [Diabrotica balteata]|uniref:Uncharacterized protein n=1 Tax=Diabrotica balteata TaxID=107213 RepID=A0A9N9STQ3_DIABA|nr:unnamed protein product [Diabrotica balteata]